VCGAALVAMPAVFGVGAEDGRVQVNLKTELAVVPAAGYGST